MTLGPCTDLLVNQPQRVLDVWILERDGRGGAPEQLHEQAVHEPDWGEDHVAQLKQQGRPKRSAWPRGGPAPRPSPKHTSWSMPPDRSSARNTLSPVHPGTLAPCWCQLGDAINTKLKLMKPITVLLSHWKSPISPEEQGQRKLCNRARGPFHFGCQEAQHKVLKYLCLTLSTEEGA